MNDSIYKKLQTMQTNLQCPDAELRLLGKGEGWGDCITKEPEETFGDDGDVCHFASRDGLKGMHLVPTLVNLYTLNKVQFIVNYMP